MPAAGVTDAARHTHCRTRAARATIRAREVQAMVAETEFVGESGREWRALFERVPLGVVVMSRAGVVRWANGGALDLVGRDLCDVVGHPLTDLLHPDDRQAARERMRFLATTGASPPLRD